MVIQMFENLIKSKLNIKKEANLLLSTSKISFEQTIKATTTKINKNGKLYKYKVIILISFIL